MLITCMHKIMHDLSEKTIILQSTADESKFLGKDVDNCNNETVNQIPVWRNFNWIHQFNIQNIKHLIIRLGIIIRIIFITSLLIDKK